MSTTVRTASTNYSNRTVDMLFLQFVQAPIADAVVKPNVVNQPRIVTGIEKTVQRFALLFLTQVGTVMNRSSEGTEFMSLLGSGRIYDESTLASAAAVANKEVLMQMKEEDAFLNTPDDEAIAMSEVTNLSISRATASVSVTISITTASGDTYTYITPLETGV